MRNIEPRGVLLDVDGTLVDSNDAHARAWAAVLTEAGYDVPVDRVRPLIGEGGDKLLPQLTGLRADSPRARELSAQRKRLFLERFLPLLRPFPGARALLERLRREELALVVATSASDEELGALLDAAGVRDLIEGGATKDDAARSKPDPDIVRAALARAKLPASAAVMLGDTPYDVAAARRAGVAIIALRCGGWSDSALRGAAAIYDDPADLLAHYEESPLARRAAVGG